MNKMRVKSYFGLILISINLFFAFSAGPYCLPGRAKDGCHKLAVTVRDPRCPACLKTLKNYLLAINGVQQVNLIYPPSNSKGRVLERAPGPGQRERRKVIVSLLLLNSLANARIVDRIKAHDLEILSIRAE